MIFKDKPVIEFEDQAVDPKEQQELREEIELERRQRTLLLDLVESGQLPRHVVNQMIDLGMLAQADDVMPCQQDGRHHHPSDWHHALGRYREHLRDPPPPPKEPLGLREMWEERQSRCLPSTGKYCCPLLAQADAWEEQPPVACIEARRRQRGTLGYQDDPERQALLDAPDDPVNALRLRPCRVMGDLLYDEILVAVARRKREAEARRWPAGKPRA